MGNDNKNYYNKKGFGHHQIHSEATINAPAELVWETLMDFDSYPNWARSFLGLSGDIRDGGQIIGKFQTKPNGKPLSVKHRLILVEGSHFGWSETNLGVKDNHQFIVEKVNDQQTKFIHSDEFNGLLTGFITRAFLGGAENGLRIYAEFCESIKEESERRSG